MNEKRQKSKTNPFLLLLLRCMQILCAIIVLIFSLAERTSHRWRMYAPSHCVARTMLVTACTSLLAAILACLGLYATVHAKEMRDIVLTVDTLALLCSIPMAVCITIAIRFAPWPKTVFCILSLDLAWVGLCICIILLIRHTRILLRSRTRTTTARKPFITATGHATRARRAAIPSRRTRGTISQSNVLARPSDASIAAWCDTVDPENAALLPHSEGSRTSCDCYSQSDVQDVPDRAVSPISTVANWSTVTGTPSLGQFSQAPPPYSDRF